MTVTARKPDELAAAAEELVAGPAGGDADRVLAVAGNAGSGQSREEAARIFDGLIPLGRHAAPEEIARAVLYLASDDRAMMSSHTFAIDGGLSG